MNDQINRMKPFKIAWMFNCTTVIYWQMAAEFMLPHAMYAIQFKPCALSAIANDRLTVEQAAGRPVVLG